MHPRDLLHQYAVTTMVVSWFVTASSAVAQLPNPALDYIFPAGGQRGTTVEVEVGGRDLDQATRLIGTHAGLVGMPVLRDAGEFEAGPQQVKNRFRIEIPVNMPPGTHDVRCVTKFGVSTPRRFVVTDVNQQIESGEHQKLDAAMPISLDTTVSGRADAGAIDYFRFSAAAGQTLIVQCTAQQIESNLLPVLTIWNEAGQQLARSRRPIDPIVRFKAPADGDYLLGVHDQVYGGGPLHHYRLQIHSGPYLVAAEPHVVRPNSRVSLTVYGYNLAQGQPPTEMSSNESDAVQPLQLDGQAMQRQQLTVFVPPAHAQSVGRPQSASVGSVVEGFVFFLPGTEGRSNGLFLDYASHDVMPESEPNDLPTSAQKVTFPCEVAGRFYPRRDQDWIQFDASKGEAIQVRVVSQRLGLSTDPELYIQKVAFSDDGAERVAQVSTRDDEASDGKRYRQGLRPGLEMAHRDPVVSFVADADAAYRVGLRDLNGSSLDDPRLTYRLVVERQSPSFELLVWTQQQAGDDDKKLDRAALVGRRGETLPVMIDVVRDGGFDGAIDISAENLPAGVEASPCRIAKGESMGVLLLTVDRNAMAWSGSLHVIGHAVIAGQRSTRTARSAALTSATANVEQSRPRARQTEQLTLSILDCESSCAELSVDNPSGLNAWTTSRGAKLEIPVAYLRHAEVKGDLTLAAVGLPEHVKMEPLSLKPDAADGQLKLSLADSKVVAGTYHFFLRGKINSGYARDPEAVALAESSRRDFVLLGELDRQIAEIKADLAAERRSATDQVPQLQDLEAVQDSLAKTLAQAEQQVVQLSEQLGSLANGATSDAVLEQLANATAANVAEVTQGLDVFRQSIEQITASVATARQQIDARRTEATDLEAKLVKAVARKKRAEQYAKTLDEAVEAAKKNGQAKDVVRFINSPAITLNVKSTPITLHVRNADSKSVRRGHSQTVSLDLVRRFGCTDDVTIEVELPDALQSKQAIVADPIRIAGDQSTGRVTFTAANDAPTGRYVLKLKSQLKFNDVSIEDNAQLAIEITD